MNTVHGEHDNCIVFALNLCGKLGLFSHFHTVKQTLATDSVQKQGSACIFIYRNKMRPNSLFGVQTTLLQVLQYKPFTGDPNLSHYKYEIHLFRFLQNDGTLDNIL